MIARGPDVSHFKPACSAVAACGLSGSSKYRVVPVSSVYRLSWSKTLVPGTISITRSSSTHKPILNDGRERSQARLRVSNLRSKS